MSIGLYDVVVILCVYRSFVIWYIFLDIIILIVWGMLLLWVMCYGLCIAILRSLLVNLAFSWVNIGILLSSYVASDFSFFVYSVMALFGYWCMYSIGILVRVHLSLFMGCDIILLVTYLVLFFCCRYWS